MAKVTYEDGTIINFDGDPSPKEIEEAYNSVQSSKPQVEPKSTISGLPRQQEVEQEISKRPNLINQFIQKIQQPGYLGQAVRKPLMPTQDILAGGGGVYQRGEAAIANPLMALQKGQPQRIGQEFLSGVIGQRQGEFGDIIRTTGFGGILNEPLAKTIGFLSSMGLTNMATRGKLIEAATKAGELTKQHLPQVMNDEWLTKQATSAYGVADDVVKAVQNEYDDLYKNIDDVIVDESKLKGIVNQLTGGVKEESQQLINELTTEFEGKPIPFTINAARRIKNIIQKYIPESAWIKGKKNLNMTPRQEKLADAWFKTRDLVKDTLKKHYPTDADYLEYLDKKATDTYRLAKAIKGMVVDETGQPHKTTQLISTFVGGPSSSGKRKLFERLAQLDSNTMKVIRNMNKFKNRQAIETFAKRVAGATLIGYPAYHLMKKMAGRMQQ